MCVRMRLRPRVRSRVLGDLWGPLLVCLLLSTILSLTAPGDSGTLVFAAVFVIVWAGAAVVTLNAQLLGPPHTHTPS